MKRRNLSLLVAAFVVAMFASQAFSQEHKHEKETQKMTFIGTGEMKYACPMKDDVVFSSEPGECPKCGMDMKEMTPEEMENMHNMMQKTGMMQHKTGESINVVGEVIDTGCYLRGEMKGVKHVQCAEMCSAAGIPLGILESSTNKIYLPVPKMGKNPNEQLKAYVGQQVTVTGTLLEKGGLSGIDIEKVEKKK